MTVLAAVLVGCAVHLALPRGAHVRLRSLHPRSRGGPRPGLSPAVVSRAAAACAAVGILVAVGGVLGVLLAVGCVVAVPRLSRRLETRAGRERRTRLVQQAPVVADLLAATLSAGAPMRVALHAVCRALGDPAREMLAPVLGAVELGADTEAAWAVLRGDPALGALASAIVRSESSGAPLAGVLARLADDLRREHHAAVQVAARSAGVRAVLPLAACFLPAFLLLGVVPVVAALAGGLLS